jgi:hypothetical protein
MGQLLEPRLRLLGRQGVFRVYGHERTPKTLL